MGKHSAPCILIFCGRLLALDLSVRSIAQCGVDRLASDAAILLQMHSSFPFTRIPWESESQKRHCYAYC